MFSYEFYKVLHLLSMFAFFGTIGAGLYAPERPKLIKILSGVSSFLILVAGMGLLARIGGGWPTWVIMKMVFWLLLAIGAPVATKRLQSSRNLVFSVLLIIGGAAAWVAVNKPF